MTLEQYNAIQATTIADLPFKEADIFNPEGSPMLEEILKSFDFYHKTLINECGHYGIAQHYILFSSGTTKNAAAGTIDGKYVILLNIGLINWLISNFQLGHNINVNSDLEALNKLQNKLDISINEFYYQLASHFTFYHELGHLIQKSDFLNDRIQESSLNNHGGFNFEKHILEFDADCYSSLCLANHVVDYYERLFVDDFDKEVIEALTILSGTAICQYILTFVNDIEDLYFKDRSHPHPAIRLLYSLMTFCTYLKDTWSNKGVNIHFETVFMNIFYESINLEKDFLGSDNTAKLLEIIKKERPSLLRYIAELQSEASGREDLAVYKRNQTLL
ncbi:hypothetical protein [Winogradskyella sp. 3972H.M.0a.05]|uniref:hypothetical protein n=1 Tax=Winogradskyella sp. 3972H.M.0a.05 TaxID=2950277 RepID=UPI00339B9ABC